MAEFHAAGSARTRFPATRWSLILAVRNHPETTQAREALANLCGAYWYPLYAYVRRHGISIEEAQDLTQGFFVKLIEKDYLEEFDRDRGRFRTFLIAAFRHYVANERDRERSQKRGGGILPFSLDTEAAERYLRAAADNLTPEKIYERQWAMLVLERALARLRRESRRPIEFERLRIFLTGEPAEISYSGLAAELGMSVGALKVAVHRLRRRFRDLLRAEVADTVAGPDEVQEEMRYLLSAILPQP